MDLSHYIQLIENASVYDVAIQSPLEKADKLSNKLGVPLYMKREDLQPVFSFKLRGAYNKLANLDLEALQQGVICSSAGNHAQGVALAAKRKGVHAVIVMPITTPTIKINAVRALGGDVRLFGDNYDEAYEKARQIEQEEGLSFVHPFDDPHVIAGQGTIAIELLQQMPDDISAIFVPIGGGGLIAGIAAYIKAKAPRIKIIGVQPADSAAMRDALKANKPVSLDHVGLFADGVAVKRVGDETFRVCQATVDEIITVTTDQTCAAIKDIYEDTRSIVEPAGGLAVAGIKQYLSQNPETNESGVVAINCGANVNFDRLRHIAERAGVGENLEMLLAVEIPERPGSFKQFCELLGRRAITEFNYRFNNSSTAHIFVGIQLVANERSLISEQLKDSGYSFMDLSNDEMAKTHIRHMVGGSGRCVQDERLYRFIFPERPGALLNFLQAIGDKWNISLFHYRNHGSDYGRVLTGIQVPADEREELHEHLNILGYLWYDETDNPGYQMFLR